MKHEKISCNFYFSVPQKIISINFYSLSFDAIYTHRYKIFSKSRVLSIIIRIHSRLQIFWKMYPDNINKFPSDLSKSDDSFLYNTIIL